LGWHHPHSGPPPPLMVSGNIVIVVLHYTQSNHRDKTHLHRVRSFLGDIPRSLWPILPASVSLLRWFWELGRIPVRNLTQILYQMSKALPGQPPSAHPKPYPTPSHLAHAVTLTRSLLSKLLPAAGALHWLSHHLEQSSLGSSSFWLQPSDPFIGSLSWLPKKSFLVFFTPLPNLHSLGRQWIILAAVYGQSFLSQCKLG
jgi:hypothetical protein